ncbi:hypothetical protein IRP63_05310 [Clostridium botulinum]|nr:hypothetical protein [Clostridium botulinum]MCD3234595.1 hypothetical protein [Clostridium botulinum D/C]MCD3239738.1 hypothetical protein [Clostridium botulinum D/C]MCD3268000.1 hypothetical protein [Clostridium botulinum D/C]MCD3299065.1 hypothetical protein [Clostridium botulinum D/C]MCD3305563.1 hypothetical protein [Clostridium botulinum D/C]
MKIIIMNANKNDWYSSKLGKVYEVKKINKFSYTTRQGEVSKHDAQIVER